jgi:WhiB family transcriptional regulator, redox-sensing transcriptional regulator
VSRPTLELLLGIGDQSWRDHALCAQTDPDAMFPEKGEGTRSARTICGMCPVRASDIRDDQGYGGTGECLEYALANQERFGVWGGKSERERRLIQRDRDGLPAEWAS